MLFFGESKSVAVKASMILLFSLKHLFYIPALLKDPTIFQHFRMLLSKIMFLSGLAALSCSRPDLLLAFTFFLAESLLWLVLERLAGLGVM
jgi:hypothetical protein